MLCFNGAALVGVRRDSVGVLIMGDPEELQRGRTRGSAESEMVKVAALPVPQLLQRGRTRGSAERGTL